MRRSFEVTARLIGPGTGSTSALNAVHGAHVEVTVAGVQDDKDHELQILDTHRGQEQVLGCASFTRATAWPLSVPLAPIVGKRARGTPSRE